MATNFGNSNGGGLGIAVGSNHVYGKPQDNLGFVDFVFERISEIDPNKSIATTAVIAGIEIIRSRIPKPLKALGVGAAGAIALAATSEIRNANLAERAAQRLAAERTVEIIERG